MTHNLLLKLLLLCSHGLMHKTLGCQQSARWIESSEGKEEPSMCEATETEASRQVDKLQADTQFAHLLPASDKDQLNELHHQIRTEEGVLVQVQGNSKTCKVNVGDKDDKHQEGEPPNEKAKLETPKALLKILRHRSSQARLM